MRGRKPTPTRLKTARGNPGRRKLNKKEPKFFPDNPKPPNGLSRETKERWKYIVGQLRAAQVITKGDYPALCACLEAYDDYLVARKIVKKEGHVARFIGSTGHAVRKKNPAYEVMTDAWKRYVDVLKEFGLTPSSRSRVIRTEPAKEEDPFAEYDAGKFKVHEGGKR